MKSIASAPGKVILVGEHFVVAGKPAIAMAVNLRARATVETVEGDRITIRSKELKIEESFSPESINTRSPLYPVYIAADLARRHISLEEGLDITITSELPPAAGMGSSAAVSVATAAAVIALRKKINRGIVSKIAFEAEKIVHGKPSGIDNTISTYGGAILYVKGKGFTRINLNLKDVALILADTGVPRSTGEMVAKVRKLKARYGSVLDPVYESAEILACEVAKALEMGDIKTIGELMNINHGLLSAIGVSTLELEQLVYMARNAGALGAKLTGAGGGGLIVALCHKKSLPNVEDALKKFSKRVYIANISKRGVIIEHKTFL
ncbi:MAG: mevalonate kinase [Thermoprotei archaeon]|nr:MAG: mevalonate kinase [Thermoprotei archaeon]